MSIEELKKTSAYAEEALVVDVQSLIHSLMEDKGITRAELANKLGVSRARVTQMFSSECSNFTIRLLARTFHALGEVPELTCDGYRTIERRNVADRNDSSELRNANELYWHHALECLNDNFVSDMEVTPTESSSRVSGIFASASAKAPVKLRVA